MRAGPHAAAAARAAGLLALAGALALTSVPAAAAAAPVASAAVPTGPSSAAVATPRTAWGDPDFTGAYTEFTTAPLERPPELGEQEFFTTQQQWQQYAQRRLEEVDQDDETQAGTPEDVHYDMGTFQLSENEGRTTLNMRTSIVVRPRNGRIPPLTPAAVARRDAAAAARAGREFDGPEFRSLAERCIVWPSTLPPILPRGYNSNLQIFQSPGYVIIQGEMGDPRIIPTDGRALPANPLPQWNGTSVGRWDGDTLVIETAGFHPDAAWRGATPGMRVTERLRRLAADALEYSFTVVDPDTWAEPWSGVYPLTRIDGLLFEYACTEGNYGMANILAGARKRERDAAAQPAPPQR